jgi:predicted nuclease of predicted toxin-antitoxin system
MKLLIDQDVYGRTIEFLRGLRHDIVTAAELGMSQASDSELLSAARRGGRILVTRDRDYGSLVFVESLSSGVLYLRMMPSNMAVVHAELERVLSEYAEAILIKAFVVVEPGRHRLRRLLN